MDVNCLEPGTWIRWDDDSALGVIVRRVVLMGGRTVRYGVAVAESGGFVMMEVNVSVARVSYVFTDEEQLLLYIQYGR